MANRKKDHTHEELEEIFIECFEMHSKKYSYKEIMKILKDKHCIERTAETIRSWIFRGAQLVADRDGINDVPFSHATAVIEVAGMLNDIKKIVAQGYIESKHLDEDGKEVLSKSYLTPSDHANYLKTYGSFLKLKIDLHGIFNKDVLDKLQYEYQKREKVREEILNELTPEDLALVEETLGYARDILNKEANNIN